MSMEYKTYITQLRDGVAMRIHPVLVRLAVSQAVDDYSPQETASDAWEYAQAFIDEREKRYGPAPAEKLEYVVWGKEEEAWWARDARGFHGDLEHAGRFTKSQAEKIKERGGVEVLHIDEARANER